MSLSGDRINALQEKPMLNYYANAGIYLIRRELLDNIPEDSAFDATELIQIMIDSGKKVVRYPIAGYWVDIGRPEDYAKVKELVKHVKKSD
jgi:NDP-sugar pyrophosphorylase family protein